MPGKAGMRWSDDKLKPPSAKAPEDLVDPGKGEKLPRCRICGVPATSGNPLYPGLFVWTGGVPYVRIAKPQNQCRRCTEDPKYEPGDADMLQLDVAKISKSGRKNGSGAVKATS